MRIIMLLLPSFLLLFGIAGISKVYGQLSYSSFASSPSYSSLLLSASYEQRIPGQLSYSFFTSSLSYTSLLLSSSYEPPTSDCGGYYRSRNGTIRHPHNGGDYSNNEECKWLIYTDSIIRFTRFHTEEEYDFLYIRDGNSSNSPLIGNYSGYELPPPVQGSSEGIFLRFTSDYSIVQTGFELQWGYSKNCSFNGTVYQPEELVKIDCSRFWCNGRTGDLYYGGIDNSNCRRCKAYLEPHIMTYDAYEADLHWFSYSYQGCGNYSMTQPGSTYQPSVAVYATFKPCGGSSYLTCVDTVTFKANVHTAILIEFKNQKPEIEVNGVAYTDVHDFIPRAIKINGITYPVLAWISNGCVMLQGYQGILVQFCPGEYGANTLHVWASPSVTGGLTRLRGLCGTANDNIEDDFTLRNGTVLTPYWEDAPAAFPLSWLNSSTSNGDCGSRSLRLNRQTPNRCQIDSSLLNNFYTQCNMTVMSNYQNAELHEATILIDDCVFDLCRVQDPDAWISAVRAVAQVQADIEEKTFGCFWNGEIFPQNATRQGISGTETCASGSWIKHPTPEKPRCENGIFQGGWKGKCFGTQHTLKARDRCDSIIYDNTTSGCPADADGLAEACCVDCSKQHRICNRRHRGSIGHNRPCCLGFLEMNTPRQGSGCACCKNCQPRAWCRRHRGHHHCITKHDPHYNRDWCLRQGNWTGRIFKRQCKGSGCWCCIWE